jgi:signal transduction histidine kinase/ActR/RegA family two-component response regulator
MFFFLKTDRHYYNLHLLIQYGVLLLVFILVVWSIVVTKNTEHEQFVADALNRCQVIEVATADIILGGADNWVTLIQKRVDALQKRDPNLIRLSVIAKAQNDTYRHVASSLPSRIGKLAHPEDLEAIDTGNIVILEEPYQDISALDITYPVHSFEGSVVAILGYTVRRDPGYSLPVILGVLSLVSLFFLSVFHILQTRIIINQSEKFQQSQILQADLKHKLMAEEQMRIVSERSLQSQKLESLGLLAGGIAHNFNNNLAIILGNIQLVQIRLTNTSENFELLDNAKTAVMRSRELIQKLLRYSRSSNHIQEPISLYPVVDETLELLTSTIPKTIDLKVMLSEISKKTITVADSIQIQEALINLCTNAVHAMGETGEMTVSLDVETLEQNDFHEMSSAKISPGEYLKLSVKDSGCGIPESIYTKIFDPFFSTKDASEGAGMGLATIHATMDSHHGLIRVDSVVGEGSTFTLYFPITEKQQITKVVEDSSAPMGNQENILFLDDEEHLAVVWGQLLREHGYQVTTVTNSLEALELFNKDPHRFDLIITDQSMPNLSGKAFLEKILHIRPEMPTILCTGHSSQIDAAEAKQLGISAFFLKPLNFSQLMQTISQVLAGK